MDETKLQVLRLELATIERTCSDYTHLVREQTQLVADVDATLPGLEENLFTLRSKNTPIVMLGEYRRVRQEVQDTRKRLRGLRFDLNLDVARLKHAEKERIRVLTMIKNLNPDKEPCGKLLKFDKTKTRKNDAE